MTDLEFLDQTKTALARAATSEPDLARSKHWLDLAEAAGVRLTALRRRKPELPVMIDLAGVPAGHQLGATLAANVLSHGGPTCTEFWGSTNGARNAVRRFADWCERAGQHNLAAACRAIKLTASDQMARLCA